MCGSHHNSRGWMLLISLLCPYTWSTGKAWEIVWNTTSNNSLIVHMDDMRTIGVILKDLPSEPSKLHFYSSATHVASVSEISIDPACGPDWCTELDIKGKFLGKSRISCEAIFNDGHNETGRPYLEVMVVRRRRILDHLFTGGVATLVAVLYINFGAALDWKAAASILRRPVGPVVCFVAQFLFMPLISYALGCLLFPKNPEMALGLFFTGVSPAGGASNIWTLILGGNLNLSVTMTTISTLAAFGMMPLWIFTLGKHIFDSGKLAVPYDKIGMYSVALIVPLGIGFCIQKYLPRVTRVLVRILKPVSTLLILFIIIFATVANLYMFELFSWQIITAGLCLPWLGYLAGFIGAKAFKQPPEDVLAISIETGIQNTGISIFLLGFTLPQPEGDLTTVVPVAVAIMTPVPLMMIYIYKICKKRFFSSPELVPFGKDVSLSVTETP